MLAAVPAPTRPRKPAPSGLSAPILAIFCVASGAAGCGGEQGSNLERRAADEGAPGAAQPATVNPSEVNPPSATPAASVDPATASTSPATSPAPTTTPAPAEAIKPGPGGLLSPGSGDKILLHLALPEGATYRVTTVGMAQFPVMPKPTGFAREESLTFSECAGEGPKRVCTVAREITNFDAEPPYGKFIAGDEKPFRALTTRHRLKASGEVEDEVAVGGPAEALETPAATAITEVHPFYCIRFPEVPIGVGARWEVTCTGRSDGRLSRRAITWELTSIVDDPADGKRVELRQVGTYTMDDPKGGVRNGTLAGSLLFFADVGAPHVLREAMATDVVTLQGLKTQTSTNLQFALVDPKDPKKTTRTDGKPFPPPVQRAAGGAESAAPTRGTTPAGESEPKPTPKPKPKPKPTPPPPT